ncbi:MAG: right-handed parallel beta-helix repeat-containing protein [Thermoplasmata archaeon]
MDKTKVLLVVLVVLVSVSFVAVLSSGDRDVPIRVEGNEEFASLADSEGWDGDGSADDPWVIEDYEIDGSDHGYGIYIGNVTDHFIIRGCHVYNSSGGVGEYYDNSEIYIYNSRNGLIEDNTLTNRIGHTINIVDSENIDLVDNEVIGETVIDYEGFGINIADSRGINVTGNHVEGHWEVPTVEHGVFIEGSRGVIIQDNHIEGNDHYGIGLLRSDKNVVKGNTLKNNSWGIYLEISDSNELVENILFDNGYGVFLEKSEEDIYSKNNSIYHNDFVRNGDAAWDSYGTVEDDHNRWDNGTLGNYWSDYKRDYPDAEEENEIWDTPYEIKGREEEHRSKDRFPAVEPMWYEGEDPDEPAGTHPVWWVVFGVIALLIVLRAAFWVRARLGVKVEK